MPAMPNRPLSPKLNHRASDAEWDVAMHHMRIRANLTAEEHRKILEFLKSAN